VKPKRTGRAHQREEGALVKVKVHHLAEGSALRTACLERGVTRAQLGQIARFYNGGTQLGTTEAIDLLLVRLTEAERKLAKITHALSGDERRAA
jgi:hypothetical protein